MKIDICDEVDLSTAFDMALRIAYDIKVLQSTACTESKPLMGIQLFKMNRKRNTSRNTINFEKFLRNSTSNLEWNSVFVKNKTRLEL